jgi:hypothetical protein
MWVILKPFTQQDIVFREEKCHTGKLRKDRITVLVAANTEGSENCPY